MTLDDNELLNFPPSSLAMSDTGDARKLLHDHGDVFRAQLIAARWLDGYRLRRLAHQDSVTASADWPVHERGFDEAMLDVIAHLRQGDFLPGGTLYEDEMSGRNEPHPPEHEPTEHDDDDPPGPGRASRDW